MTQETPAVVPPLLAERFSKAYTEFVDAVRSIVNEAVRNPSLSSSPGLLMWQTQALPRLEEKNERVQNAMALYLVGETRSIVNVASDERHLSRELDGFDLNFAGADRGKILDQLETMVAITAYQVCAAAGIP